MHISCERLKSIRTKPVRNVGIFTSAINTFNKIISIRLYKTYMFFVFDLKICFKLSDNFKVFNLFDFLILTFFFKSQFKLHFRTNATEELYSGVSITHVQSLFNQNVCVYCENIPTLYSLYNHIHSVLTLITGLSSLKYRKN